MDEKKRIEVVSKVRTYLTNKDVNRTSIRQAYSELYPDQVMFGDFEECFRAAMKPQNAPLDAKPESSAKETGGSKQPSGK